MYLMSSSLQRLRRKPSRASIESSIPELRVSYVRELHTLSYHIFMPIDEFTLRHQILTAIPQSICNWFIMYKDLSTSTSPVADWVNAIERRKRELLEQEAYTALLAAAK